MTDILADLADLHKQATTERSHYYTGNIIKAAMAEITALRDRKTPRQIVCEEWHRAVREFKLTPGSPTETVVARIVNRLDYDPS